MIYEGVHDQNTFKAIFLAGPPASGKTEFYTYALKGKNLKHLDSDKIMSFLIKKYGGDIRDTSSYDKFHKKVYQKLDMMNKMYTNGGLGLAIDGTGHNTEKYLRLKDQLEGLGYKTMMVFVNRPIEKSMEYADQRERAVDKSYIKKVAAALQDNIPVYKSRFNDFIEVEGMNDESYETGRKAVNVFLAS